MKVSDSLCEAGHASTAARVPMDAPDDAVLHAAERQRALAFTDPLCGLANRAGLLARLEALPDDAGGDAMLALLHVDGLARYNAAHGFAEGDQLIVALARVIEDESLRLVVDAFCARLQGACFAVVVARGDEASARAFGERLRAYLHAAIDLIDVSGELDFAVGISSCRAGASTAELLAAADTALASARHLGAGALVIDWQTALPEVASQAWRRRLDRALADQRFFLAGQDVFALGDDGSMTSCVQTEVLARLRLEDGDELPAGQFVPMAARHGLLGAIDRTCLGLLVDGLAQPGAPAGRHAIHLSADALRRGEFKRDLLEHLERLGERASSLLLEVSVFAAHAMGDELDGLMRQAGRFGVSLSIDQYGLNTQGFEALRRFAPAQVKLAGSLLQGVLPGDEKHFYLESVCRIATTRKLVLIATCVESAEQLPMLRRLGVHAVQGRALAPVRPLFRTAGA